MPTKIEWIRNPNGTPGYTWNPVRGCMMECEYCYAKKNNKRFWDIVYEKEKEFIERKGGSLLEKLPEIKSQIKDFQPIFLYSRFNVKFPAKPSHIFVNSMSDIVYWKTSWMELVLKKIAANPQHTFFFLTKNSNTYRQFVFPCNCWLGVTVDTQVRLSSYQTVYKNSETWFPNPFFISIEPILENIDLARGNDETLLLRAKWIIVGAETGNRKEKVIPEIGWIENIREVARKAKIPLFMKNSLKEIWGEGLVQEFPEFKKF